MTAPVSAAPPLPAEPETARSGHQPMGASSVSLAILTTVFWGGTAVSNQFVMDVLPPLFVGGLRFALAALFMFFWCLLDGSPLGLKRNQWWPVWIMGVLLYLQIGTFNIGADRSSTSHASILVNSYIFWVAVWEHFISRTIQLVGRQWIGLVLAALGCGWVFLETGPSQAGSYDEPTVIGDLILALSGFILAIKIVYTKECVRVVPPGTLILWHDIVGTLLFFITCPLLETQKWGRMTPEAWWALLYSGLIVSGFCFGANAMLLRKHGASQVSVFSFGTPIVGVALGVWLRGDHLSIGLLGGGILVAIGIYLVNKTGGAGPSQHGNSPECVPAETGS
ncbi:DMT family transporter [Planctomicrobium piriforme]|uniref:Permease of the drug/metabolite transporter (DMT) superfamily n=1 Tax=Planctomicrobium piriforme TaxID=1576369 RepID=A0A1I3S8H3_9PLAN|nr:DMT family transporter [Planctomicrobium piriforme]SFJ53851.1 Permease of the drug/metabolite transporter (DMT) superfamily [Planctomicrobium piriforme]